MAVKWVQKNLNKYLNDMLGTKKDYVIAIDTDSIYLDLSGIVDKTLSRNKQKELGSLKVIRQMDKVCASHIQPIIDNACLSLKEYLNAYTNTLDMKREALADKAIWTGKKRYMINVYNNEGIEYAKPKLKVTGMEAINTSYPKVCRDKMFEAFDLIINKEDEQGLRALVASFRIEFNKLNVQDIAFPKGVNGIETYTDAKTIYGFKTPAHTKGAILFNHHLKKLNLLDKYQELKDGEKIKYVYLKEPNPLRCEVISFSTVIPKEFDVEKYIDYAVMYEKSYIGAIENVAKTIGWRIDDSGSLEDLFG